MPAATKDIADERLARTGNNFNFLRLLFAALVLLSHSFELVDYNNAREPLIQAFHTLTFGSVALDGFFLISGFLIVQSWQQEPRLPGYFKKRALRIYPAFIVAFLISVLIVGRLGAASPTYYQELDPAFLLLKMLKLQPPEVDKALIFPGQYIPLLNGPMWTISYEFRCYALAALLGSLGFIRRRYFWLAATLCLIALYPFKAELSFAGLPAATLMQVLLGNSAEIVRLTLCFFAGGSYFLFLDKIRFSNPLAWLAFLLLIPAMFSFYSAEIALATLGAYLLFWFAFLKIPSLDSFKYRSDVSYGLYLYGWPIQKLLLWYVPALPPYLLFALTLPMAWICGYLSWRLVERPALSLKRRTFKDSLVSA